MYKPSWQLIIKNTRYGCSQVNVNYKKLIASGDKPAPSKQDFLKPIKKNYSQKEKLKTQNSLNGLTGEALTVPFMIVENEVIYLLTELLAHFYLVK